MSVHIQPCGYRSVGAVCGQYGVCVRTHRGAYMFTSCRCSAGYRGWTCDDAVTAQPAWKLVTDTLLLTLRYTVYTQFGIMAVPNLFGSQQPVLLARGWPGSPLPPVYRISDLHCHHVLLNILPHL